MKCVKKCYIFEPPQKNRRLTPQEFEDDLYIAKWLKRPPRNYLLDKPFYPWLVPEPLANQPIVNFKLNFTE